LIETSGVNIGERNNLLITYIEDFEYKENGKWIYHPDPTLGPREYSYCTGHKRLLKCGKGNYVFFHTTKTNPATGQDGRFITAYFVIKDVGLGKQIVPKYGITGTAKHAENMPNHYAIVGKEKCSKKLQEPGLPFDRHFAKKLAFDPPKSIRFDIVDKNGEKLSDLQCIASATRNIRILTDSDVKTLLGEIKHQGL
jgi:hypothetical protein